MTRTYATSNGAASGGGFSIENASGTVDGSNISFTVTHTPLFLFVDGGTYFQNFGYSLSGLSITMAFPPNSYVKSAYS